MWHLTEPGEKRKNTRELASHMLQKKITFALIKDNASFLHVRELISSEAWSERQFFFGKFYEFLMGEILIEGKFNVFD